MPDNATDEIKLDIERKKDCLVIRVLLSEITFRTSKRFLQEVKLHIDKQSCNIILDLSNVELIDSVSLGTLVAIKKYVKSQGCDVVITGLSQPIKELFRLLNFYSVFKIFDTVDDALNEAAAPDKS